MLGSQLAGTGILAFIGALLSSEAVCMPAVARNNVAEVAPHHQQFVNECGHVPGVVFFPVMYFEPFSAPFAGFLEVPDWLAGWWEGTVVVGFAEISFCCRERCNSTGLLCYLLGYPATCGQGSSSVAAGGILRGFPGSHPRPTLFRGPRRPIVRVGLPPSPLQSSREKNRKKKVKGKNNGYAMETYTKVKRKYIPRAGQARHTIIYAVVRPDGPDRSDSN